MNLSSDLSKLFNIAAQSDATVLITGSTGTGKTTLAKKIHSQSKRSREAFVSVNLATLNEGLLESELFGHERGSFTGADRKRSGKLELAHRGTVFLDEVGELSPRMQARLLEFLHSKVISPVGSNQDIHLDVRIVAATHRNLAQSVARGEFREDLFHRLRVISFPLKPLKERVDELDELIHCSLAEVGQFYRKSIFKLSPAVAERFESYSWPGNIRELRNVLEYAVLACETGEIQLEDLPAWMQVESSPIPMESVHAVLGVAEVSLSLDFQDTLVRFEKEYLRRALSRNGGRINRTARQIGVNKTTLLRRIRAYGMNLSSP